MNNFLKISVSLFALTLFYSCSDSNTIQTKLEVDGGQIEGMAKGSLKQYLGIPYAAPPVGELRWSPPQPLNPWSGVKDASVNSKICHQPKQPTEFYDRGPDQSTMSEDCLTLNVWTRADTA